MKLAKIVTSTVAIIAAITAGGSWYTGKKIEEKYQQLIEQANSQLKVLSSQYDVGKMEIKDVQIERGFFSSDAKYRLEVEMSDGDKLEFVGNDKIHHGPLPLNRLVKFNLNPVMMSAENYIQAPKQFEKIMGEKLGAGVVNIGYSGKVEGEFTSSSIKSSNDKAGSIEISPIKIEYSHDQDAKNTEGAVYLDIFKLKLEKEKIDFQIQDLSYEIQRGDNLGYANLGLGKSKAKVKSIEFKSENGELSKVKDILFQGENVLKDERVVHAGLLKASSFNIEGVELGKLKMDLGYDVDAKLANDIVTELFFEPKALRNTKKDDTILLQLLEKSAKLRINDFSLEKDNGKFDLDLILSIAQFSSQRANSFNEMLSIFSQSKFMMNVNREYAEDIISQISIVKEKLSKEQAKNAAKRQVDALLVNTTDMGFRMPDDNNIKMELVIDNGKILLNNRELSEKDIQMLFFAIMMWLGK